MLDSFGTTIAEGATLQHGGGFPDQTRPVADETGLQLMSLDEVRNLRNELSELESRISYWRRILQARIDLLRDGSIKRGATVEGLNRVLSQHLGKNNRLAMMTTEGDQDRPPIEGLGELWNRSINRTLEDDEPLLEDLEAAEHELSAKRSELFGKIDAATAELVRRYRIEPQLALSALPSRAARPVPL